MFFLYVNVNKLNVLKVLTFILDIELLFQGIMFISYIIIMCLSCFSTKNPKFYVWFMYAFVLYKISIFVIAYSNMTLLHLKLMHGYTSNVMFVCVSQQAPPWWDLYDNSLKCIYYEIYPDMPCYMRLIYCLPRLGRERVRSCAEIWYIYANGYLCKLAINDAMEAKHNTLPFHNLS